MFEGLCILNTLLKEIVEVILVHFIFSLSALEQLIVNIEDAVAAITNVLS
jgi:hypothetical protein